MAQKAKKKSKLRHAEYYDMQKTFDSLYADSKSGEVFGHLMDIISAPSNIKLAFRNIKGNDGSHTAGTDGRTIESLAVMPEDNFVKLIQKQFRRYEPKAVKRVEIPKPNGKMRPLGIPCIIDRIVQQCILQVMEPICEAKFYEHSYGFRPCRSAENAISYAYGLAQRNNRRTCCIGAGNPYRRLLYENPVCTNHSDHVWTYDRDLPIYLSCADSIRNYE